MVRPNLTVQAIDDVLAGTFPASDPPAWMPGMARPAPRTVVDESRPPRSRRTVARALVSLIAAMALALMLPLAIVAVAVPVVLGLRGLLEVAERLLTMIR